MCQCEQFVKFGKDHKGNQRYRCKTCRRIWVDNPNSTHLNENDKDLIEKMLKENLSLRAIARIIGCHHTTILTFLRKKAQSS